MNKDEKSLIMMNKIEGDISCILLFPDEQVFEKIYSNIVVQKIEKMSYLIKSIFEFKIMS